MSSSNGQMHGAGQSALEWHLTRLLRGVARGQRDVTTRLSFEHYVSGRSRANKTELIPVEGLRGPRIPRTAREAESPDLRPSG